MKPIFYSLVKFTGWLVLRIGFGLEVRGQENVPKKGSFLLACNHASYMDPVVAGVACPRPVSYLSRQTLFRNPIFGWFLKQIYALPIRRGEADISAMRVALARLKEGFPVGIFPEGTRQAGGKLGTAKRGVGLVALRAKVPIVPVLVKGTYEAWPRGHKWPRFSKIRVAFGAVIPYTVGSSKSGREEVSGSEALSEEPDLLLRSGNSVRSAPRASQDQLAEAVTRRWRQLEEELTHHERN